MGKVLGISQRIKSLRKKNNLNQEDFAAKIEATRNNVAQWEAGNNNPSLDNLTKICEVFGTTADWVLFGTEKMPLVAAEDREHYGTNLSLQDQGLSPVLLRSAKALRELADAVTEIAERTRQTPYGGSDKSVLNEARAFLGELGKLDKKDSTGKDR